MCLREFAIFIIFAFLRCSIGGLAGAGANQQEFNVLCYVTRLVQGSEKIEKPTFPAGVTESIELLGVMNMSVAPETWKNLFGQEGTIQFDPQKEPFSALKEDVRADWGKNWARWQKSAEEYSKKKKDMKPPPKGPTRQALALRIAKIYDRVIVRGEEFEREKKKAEKARTDAAEFLKMALEGANKTDGNDGKRVAFATNYAAGCGSGGSGNTDGKPSTEKEGGPGASIKNDLVCLCGFASTATNSPCRQDINFGGGSSKVYDNPTKADLAWTEIEKACPKHPEALPTEHALESGLAGFFSLLGRTAITATHAAGPYTLGSGSDTANQHCDGDNGRHGNCVNYKKQLEGDSASGILWVRNIRKAIAKLREMREFWGLANKTATKIEDLTLAAQTELEVAEHHPATVPALGIQTTTPNVTGSASAAVATDAEHFIKGSAINTRFILPWTLLI